MKQYVLLLFTFLLGLDGMASLKKYRQRRELKKTKPSAEPYGRVKKATSKNPMFVIQKHDASHVHYDFRLEIDGVLVSWAVPKGLPEKLDIRRLAIRTDNHPMQYGNFEGIIPEGHYGAGTVMVWDIGTYENIREKEGKSVSMKKALDQGTIEVFVKGKKIWGPYALIKTKGMNGKNSWILLKMKKNIVEKKPTKKRIRKNTSALTERTMKQITIDHDAQWE